MTSWLWGIAVAEILLVLSAGVAAEEEPLVEARRLFDRGVELFADENYPAALASFEASWALRESPVVLHNIAMCQRALFRFPEAIESFESYLQRWGDRLEDPERAEILELLAEMRSQLYLVSVNVPVEGTEILLNGELVGRSPLSEPIALGPGDHVIEARAPGSEPVRRSLTVTEPGAQTLELAPRRLERPGVLHITADAEGATVSVDGGEPSALPVELELERGSYTIEVAAPGHRSRTEGIEVAAGATRSLELHLEPMGEPPPPRRRAWYRTWWFWTAVGVVVAGGAAAGIAAGASDRDWGDWDVRLP